MLLAEHSLVALPGLLAQLPRSGEVTVVPQVHGQAQRGGQGIRVVRPVPACQAELDIPRQFQCVGMVTRLAAGDSQVTGRPQDLRVALRVVQQPAEPLQQLLLPGPRPEIVTQFTLVDGHGVPRDEAAQLVLTEKPDPALPGVLVEVPGAGELAEQPQAHPDVVGGGQRDRVVDPQRVRRAPVHLVGDLHRRPEVALDPLAGGHRAECLHRLLMVRAEQPVADVQQPGIDLGGLLVAADDEEHPGQPASDLDRVRVVVAAQAAPGTVGLLRELTAGLVVPPVVEVLRLIDEQFPQPGVVAADRVRREDVRVELRVPVPVLRVDRIMRIAPGEQRVGSVAHRLPFVRGHPPDKNGLDQAVHLQGVSPVVDPRESVPVDLADRLVELDRIS